MRMMQETATHRLRERHVLPWWTFLPMEGTIQQHVGYIVSQSWFMPGVDQWHLDSEILEHAVVIVFPRTLVVPIKLFPRRQYLWKISNWLFFALKIGRDRAKIECLTLNAGGLNISGDIFGVFGVRCSTVLRYIPWNHAVYSIQWTNGDTPLLVNMINMWLKRNSKPWAKKSCLTESSIEQKPSTLHTRLWARLVKAAVQMMCSRSCCVIPATYPINCFIDPTYSARCHGILSSIVPLKLNALLSGNVNGYRRKQVHSFALMGLIYIGLLDFR